MKDFLLDSVTGDLMIQDGDFVIGDSTAQNQMLLIMSPKGDFKQFPDATVGAYNYLESEDPTGLLREARLRFTQDGMKVNSLGYDANGKMLVNANY